MKNPFKSLPVNSFKDPEPDPETITLSDEGSIIMQHMIVLERRISETNSLLISLMNSYNEDMKNEDYEEDDEESEHFNTPKIPIIASNPFDIRDVM